MLPEISIAVIAKDEEKSIGSVLSDIFETIENHSIDPCEVFLIDGYSTDKTVEMAREFNIKTYRVEGGKGDGIRGALEKAKGKCLIFIDADGSHIAEDIPRLFAAIKSTQSDLVIVSRILGSSEELGTHNLDNLLRLWGNRLSAFMVNLRWKTRLTDIQNGFRIVRREALKNLDLKETGFAIEQEMVMKCLEQKQKVSEIPGTELKRQYGQSKVILRKDFWIYLWSLLKSL